MNKLPRSAVTLRRIVQERISSDFRLHLLWEDREHEDDPSFVYHAHKKWLVLRTRDEGAIKAGFRLALMAQLGGVWLGKGPCSGLGYVPGNARPQYEAWGANLNRAIYS